MRARTARDILAQLSNQQTSRVQPAALGQRVRGTNIFCHAGLVESPKDTNDNTLSYGTMGSPHIRRT